MKASKVYIFKNDEGLWECGVITSDIYLTKHESSTWEEICNWVQLNYEH